MFAIQFPINLNKALAYSRHHQHRHAHTHTSKELVLVFLRCRKTIKWPHRSLVRIHPDVWKRIRGNGILFSAPHNFATALNARTFARYLQEGRPIPLHRPKKNRWMERNTTPRRSFSTAVAVTLYLCVCVFPSFFARQTSGHRALPKRVNRLWQWD